MSVRRTHISLLTALSFALPLGVQANEWDLALDGADPVAYFDDSTHMTGTTTFAVMWRGQEWRFANADHRDAFEANPFAYVPAYDGQCAACLANGHAVKGNPQVWSIIDGQLYLNLNATSGDLWEAEFTQLRPAADDKWLDTRLSSDR